jgi:hypothetical protein
MEEMKEHIEESLTDGTGPTKPRNCSGDFNGNDTNNNQSATESVVVEVAAFGDDVLSEIRHIGDVFHPQKDHSMLADIGDNVVEKMSSALFSSIMIYAIADIRTLIRLHRDEVEGDPSDIQEFLDLPTTDVNILKITLANVSVLKKFMKETIDFYLNAVNLYRAELQNELEPNVEVEKRRPSRRSSIYQSIKSREPVTLEVCDDINSTKELVFNITVHRYVWLMWSVIAAMHPISLDLLTQSLQFQKTDLDRLSGVRDASRLDGRFHAVAHSSTKPIKATCNVKIFNPTGNANWHARRVSFLSFRTEK